jgi:hypothetical protein
MRKVVSVLEDAGEVVKNALETFSTIAYRLAIAGDQDMLLMVLTALRQLHKIYPDRRLPTLCFIPLGASDIAAHYGTSSHT